MSPRQLPPLLAQQAARAANTAGALTLARRSASGPVDEGGGGIGASLPAPPPPLWQDVKPKKRAVVTKMDMRRFQHFWLANVEKKLLMVAIPKVVDIYCILVLLPLVFLGRVLVFLLLDTAVPGL